MQRQIDRDGPQSKDGQRLVHPREIPPDQIEALLITQAINQRTQGQDENRNTNLQTACHRLLLHLQGVCHNQTTGTKSRISRGDWSEDHAQQSQASTHRTQPITCDCVHDHGRIGLSITILMEEIGGRCRPNQRHNTLYNHRSIKDGTTIRLLLHATSHHRRLGGMEARNGTTSDTDEHDWEDRQIGSLRVRISQAIGQLRQGWRLHIEHHQDTDSHEYQRNGKYRIDLAYHLVNRQKGGQNIIGEDDENPNHAWN